ncbi:MAG: radical SAM protein [Jatrophihabitantaceae bacterium]
MHIADMLVRRPVPTAGLFLSLTRRCPLTCAHCSTNSMMSSEEHDEEIFRRFVDTFTEADHPEMVWLTGGEPLLRPQLVLDLVNACHRVGSKVAIITGLYYARADGHIPKALIPALRAVDHVIVSQDIYHEVQIPRAHAFATVQTLLDFGQDVSFQVVGQNNSDPYLADVTSDIRTTFADRVPALVANLAPMGRGQSLLAAARMRPVTSSPNDAHRDAAPCTMAAWPVVGYDGAISACCQQRVIDGPIPDHLNLGNALTTGWPEVSRQLRQRSTLRAIRIIGPEKLVQDAGLPLSDCGFCTTCIHDGSRPEVSAQAEAMVASSGFAAVETEVVRLQVDAGPEYFARRSGVPSYASMMTLGLPVAAVTG